MRSLMRFCSIANCFIFISSNTSSKPAFWPGSGPSRVPIFEVKLNTTVGRRICHRRCLTWQKLCNGGVTLQSSSWMFLSSHCLHKQEVLLLHLTFHYADEVRLWSSVFDSSWFLPKIYLLSREGALCLDLASRQDLLILRTEETLGFASMYPKEQQTLDGTAFDSSHRGHANTTQHRTVFCCW